MSKKKERRKYLERNENKNATYQNICDLAKSLLRGTLTAGIKEIGNSKTIEEICENIGSLERSTKLRSINWTNQETKGGGTEEWREDKLLNLGMKKGYLPTSRHKKGLKWNIISNYMPIK